VSQGDSALPGSVTVVRAALLGVTLSRPIAARTVRFLAATVVLTLALAVAAAVAMVLTAAFGAHHEPGDEDRSDDEDRGSNGDQDRGYLA
jgi:hypothetical protein